MNLLNQREKSLVKNLSDAKLKKLSPKMLQQKRTSLRKLRDKYKDLYRRQKIKAKRSGLSATILKRTQEKEALFSDLLNKVETYFKKASTKSTTKKATKKATKKVAKKKKLTRKRASVKKIAKKAGAKKKLRAKHESLKAQSKSSKFSRKQNKIRKTPAKRIAAHVQSKGARRQARRDR